MEIVLATETPEGINVVLSALVYAKIDAAHPEARDLDVIDSAVRRPVARVDDLRPGRERFYAQVPGGFVRVVVDFTGQPGIIVTAFQQPEDPK